LQHSLAWFLQNLIQITFAVKFVNDYYDPAIAADRNFLPGRIAGGALETKGALGAYYRNKAGTR
jgi:hypothetical protein